MAQARAPDRGPTLEPADPDDSSAQSRLARQALLSVIEDQKRAEDILRVSEQRFRTLFETAPLGIGIVNPDTDIYEDVNPMFAAMLGRSHEELRGKSWRAVTHADDIGPQAAGIQALRDGTLQHFALNKRFLKKDGGTVWANLTMTQVTLPGTAGPRLLFMAQDVTETERMARNLVEEQTRFRALAEQSTVGIYTLDRGKITYINPRGAEIFGYGPDEIEVIDPLMLVAEEQRPLVAESIRKRQAGDTPILQYQFTAQRKDGTKRIVAVDSTTIILDGRRVIMGVLQDVTERMRAQEEIRNYITRIEAMIAGTVNSISIMVELRDPYTSGHERRVGELSAAIAAKMGLDENTQRGLRYAGAVHDVGKLAVPADLLSKPGRLTAVEFELVKAHAAQGYEVLKGIESPWPLAEVARQHHERMDGSGYPRGLKGEEILLEARILAVADVMESMSSHRPYRPALGIDKALEEIERGKGVHYDAAAVEACLAVFRDGSFSFDAQSGSAPA